MRGSRYKLIEPLVHPMMENDETPIGYLIRIAELNEYKSHTWISDNSGKSLHLRLHHRLYEILASEKWTGCNLDNPVVSEVLSLDINCFTSKVLRFCPLCLEKYKYYRMNWQYKTSIACTEHRVWLHDRCWKCREPVAIKNAKIRECVCGADITDVKAEDVAQEVYLMQLFLENECDSDAVTPFVLFGNSGLAKREKIDIINFFSRWIISRRASKNGISQELREMLTARDSMSDVAEALFSGREGYHAFLKRLDELGIPNRNYSVDILTKFHREFYSKFPQSCFQQYRDYLEKYINLYWEKPLTRRNKNFKDETIKTHPWIPFQKACREHDIHKSELLLAINKNLIRNKIVQTESNRSIYIYRPDLKARLTRIKDVISGKEAALILGLTKLQFSYLRDAGVFDVEVKPGTYGNTTWEFSRDEVNRYRDSFVQGLPSVIGEFWSLPQLLKYFGSQLEYPLVTILKAIENNEIAVTGKVADRTGLSSLIVGKKDFLAWYEKRKKNGDLLSVPVTAKLLGIHQEFTYQLVDSGLIESSSKGDKTSKWISHQGLEEFRQQYVLLSKLAKQTQLNSRSLVRYLASREIYSVDHDWDNKLRQKVYQREGLRKVQILASFL